MKKLIILLAALILIPACSQANTKVTMKTNMGDIQIELFDSQAPETVKNFLVYVDSGFYDGTIFHRVIKGFMIQGGGMTPGMIQKGGNPPIKNEAANGLKNTTGTLAMARTVDINSATSQFFINTADNVFLNHGARDYGYCVFGKVISGMSVVRKIESVQTGSKDYFQDVPVNNVVILSVKRTK